jgi:hypothetical protein
MKFPAEFTHEIEGSQSREQDHQRIARAAENLIWRVVRESESALEFRAGMNWKSWGEQVTVTLQPAKIQIHSRCRFAFQCFDWGRNRDNCLRFAQAYASQQH